MKLFGIQSHEQCKNTKFEGKRVNRNIVAQLAKNNPYSLSEPNQRLITNAITELGKVPGLKNIKFLTDTAAKSTYATSIKLEDKPLHDWRSKLIAAALASLGITAAAGIDTADMADKISQAGKRENLNNTEKHILKLRDNLLKSVDLEQIKKEKVGSERNFERNLNYFIVSSETTQEHKKYVLEKLNYLMSDKYEINPQLKDKKSIVVAEMINDMAIHTPGETVPNIKAVYQKHHGICAAISIVRKKLAYEDKPNYVDAILSELDSSEVIKVYDRSRLGSGKKVDVKKVPVDFNAAIDKGYRIIDASTMHWMQIAQMAGYSNGAYSVYNPFDSENFDVKRDSFFNTKFIDPELATIQEYYQALIKTNSIIEEYKADKIKKNEQNQENRANFDNNIKELGTILNSIKSSIKKISPDITPELLQQVSKGLVSLEHTYSNKIDKNNAFAYIPNEESVVKKGKITGYLKDKLNVSNIDTKLADEICDLVMYYNEVQADSQIIHDSKSKKLSEAENLYNIGASFRYQFLMSLNDKYTLDSLIHSEGIESKEDLMLQLIDKYIDKLENNSGNSELIINHFTKVFDDGKPTKDDVIEFLNQMKENIQLLTTQGFDNLYGAMTLGDRRGALITYLDSIVETINNNNENLSINTVASRLGVNPNKKEVINAVTALKEAVEKGEEEEYKAAYNLVGNLSQVSFLQSVYEDFIGKMSAENNGEFVARFLQIHGLAIEDDTTAAMSVVNMISDQVNQVAGLIDSYAEILKIKDSEGDILYSAEPKDIVIKRFEDGNIIVSAKNLRELQAHFDKILKDNSSDEFQSRQGKLNNKELYNFSNREKETLSIIKNSVNPYYSQVQKSLTKVRREIQYPLEELSKAIGTNNGRWWISGEGHSGLGSANQVRILEFMTGRPHYASDDLKKAIEIIKNNPYSGISSSSVYHDDNGWHAQYIADITPVKVKNKDGKEETKEVLFHDNTWGASENENTWIDSQGLKRTDYSDHRGGSLGYITNDKFRNGNFVDRILGDMIKVDKPDTVNSRVYKRIVHPDSSWNTPQYNDIILQGDAPELRDIAEEVRDTMFTPTRKLVDTIKLFTAKLTTDEIKAKIKKMATVEDAYKPTYEALKRRIMPEFAPGAVREVKLMTKEEYDKLADDDLLKIVTEVIALQNNYRLAGKLQELSGIKNIKELDKYRDEQVKRATEDFKYSFNKLESISTFVDECFTEDDDETLVSILKKHGIELGEDDLFGMISDYDIKGKNFDGSLKNTINTMMNGISKDIRKTVNNEAAAKELEAFLRQMLTERLYFNEEDINNKEIEHIVKFIDRVYDPADNKEFVKIYRRLQDMTTAEFKSEVLSKVTPEDLGIKNETGFDVLRKVQRYEEKANTDFLNGVWRREYFKVVNYEPTRQAYYYMKLNRRPKDLMKYNFETAYREMKNDLSMLNFEKLFNKYKGRNLDKYGAFPAYPDLTDGLLSEDMFKTSWDSCIETIPDMIEQIRLTKSVKHLFENQDVLSKYLKSTDNSYVMDEKEYNTINLLLGEIVTTLYGEKKMENACELANDLMDIEQGTEFGTYKTKLRKLVNEIENYKDNFSKEGIDQVIKINKMAIDGQNDIFVNSLVQKRYRTKVMALLNKYENGLIKKDPKTEEYKQELNEAFQAYHILRNPKEVLDTYVESLGTDYKHESLRSNIETLLKRALTYARLVDVQTILMEALEQGIETNVKKAFDKVTLETLDDEKVPMGADEIISQIVYSLIIDNREETALMFLEKFGLNEKYITDMEKTFNFNKVKEMMDEVALKGDNFSKFAEDYTNISENLFKEIEEGKKTITALNKAKKLFAISAKKWDIDRDGIKEFLGGIDKIKNYLKDHPHADKQALIQSTIPSEMEKLAAVESNLWDEINQSLGGMEVICNLANRIALNPDTEAFKKREILNEKFEELAEYNKTLNGNNNLPEEE